MSELIDTLINSVAKVTIVLHLSSKWNAQTYKDLKKHCVLLPLKIVLHFYLNKNLNNNNGNNLTTSYWIMDQGSVFFFLLFVFTLCLFISRQWRFIDQVIILFIISHFPVETILY